MGRWEQGGSATQLGVEHVFLELGIGFCHRREPHRRRGRCWVGHEDCYCRRRLFLTPFLVVSFGERGRVGTGLDWLGQQR